MSTTIKTSSSESETDSDDLFFDAQDTTPKSRNASLRKSKTSPLQRADSSGTDVSTPTITVSKPAFEAKPDIGLSSSVPVSDAVLPEEITKELEALSQIDEARKSRIERLEKLRRREDVLPGEEEDEDDMRLDQPTSLHESAESSVEGIFVTGPRPTHPFKVIEPELDRRSVSSDSRSVHGRQPSMQRLVSSSDSFQQRSSKSIESPVVESVSALTLKPVPVSAPADLRTSPIFPSQVPDIVSSARSDPPLQKVPPKDEFKNPIRPPRRKKTSITIPETVGLPPDSPKVSEASTRQVVVTPPDVSRIQSNQNQHTDQIGIFTRPTTLATSTPRVFHGEEVSGWDPLPSPDSTVASLTRELETSLNTLDIHSATKGLFVVKPQDDEQTRGDSSFVGPSFVRDRLGLDSALTSSAERTISCPDERTAKMTRDESSSYSLPSDRPSSPEAPSGVRLGSMGNRSLKGSSGSGNVGSSLGSHYNSATSGCSSDRGSGGKRSLNSGSSMESNREISGMASAPVASGLTRQMNMFLRTKSDSGKKLSDEEILKQIKVKNLDTGEEMDLVEAEDKLPQSINPLSLHIMRLTSEYVSMDRQSGSMDSDTESMVSSVSGYELGGKKKISGMKKFLGSMAKKTTDAAKSLAAEASKKRANFATKEEKDVDKKLGRLATEIMSSEGVPASSMRDGKAQPIFKRIQAHKSGPFDFEGIKFAQELPSLHLGPIWCMRFSHCGQLLATAGQDTVLRIWVLKSSYNYFKDMRNRYNADVKSSPTNSYENVISEKIANEDKSYQVFVDTPFCSYTGHTSDLLDISWSKNYFILTSSMDKTVRLWHISRRECLCCFQHIDFVTAISFHPRNDQFFLSGSLDGKLRLWNIPDKKVALWNEVDGPTKLITTANFIQNGKFAVVGTYDGRCIFYSTDQLKYYTMIHVRSARGKNAQGRKVTGIEPMPGEDKILVTSNDSRIRLYDLRDLSLTCKYKGYTNSSSQIRASFSPDGKYITAGSENQCVYIWRTQSDSTNLTVRKDRNNYYEAIKAHNAVVTCAVFAPNPDLILSQLNSLNQSTSSNTSGDDSTLTASISGDLMSSTKKTEHNKTKRDSNASSLNSGYVLISGDYEANIKVFFNEPKPKHSSLPSPTLSPTN